MRAARHAAAQIDRRYDYAIGRYPLYQLAHAHHVGYRVGRSYLMEVHLLDRPSMRMGLGLSYKRIRLVRAPLNLGRYRQRIYRRGNIGQRGMNMVMGMFMVMIVSMAMLVVMAVVMPVLMIVAMVMPVVMLMLVVVLVAMVMLMIVLMLVTGIRYMLMSLIMVVLKFLQPVYQHAHMRAEPRGLLALDLYAFEPHPVHVADELIGVVYQLTQRTHQHIARRAHRTLYVQYPQLQSTSLATCSVPAPANSIITRCVRHRNRRIAAHNQKMYKLNAYVKKP